MPSKPSEASKQPEQGGGMISAATLCELSGLTDRRHRQLAAEGFFPPPVRGQYQLRLAITGLFRYYRELHQKRGATLAKKRERKVDNENRLMEIEIGKEEKTVVDVQDFLRRWEALYVEMKQIVLGSNLADIDKDALLNKLSRLHSEGK